MTPPFFGCVVVCISPWIEELNFKAIIWGTILDGLIEQHIFKCTAAFFLCAVCMLWKIVAMAEILHSQLKTVRCSPSDTYFVVTWMWNILTKYLLLKLRGFVQKSNSSGVITCKKKAFDLKVSHLPLRRVPRPISKGENGLKEEKVGAPKLLSGWAGALSNISSL